MAANLIRVYYNPMYTPYQCPCFMIFIPEGGNYLVTKDTTFPVLNTDHLPYDGVEEFAGCRGFFSAVTIDPDTNDVVWSKRFSSPERHKELSEAMSLAKGVVAQEYKYSIYNHPRMKTVFGAMNRLTTIKE